MYTCFRIIPILATLFLIGTASLATTTSSCSVPGGLNAEPAGSTGVKLSWTAVPGARSYRLEVENDNGNPHYLHVEVTVTGASHTQMALRPGAAYKFKVRTVCADDKSDWSDFFSFRAGGGDTGGGTGPCAVPTGIQVESAASGATVVRWTAAAGAGGYEVEVEDAEGTPPFKVNLRVTATTATIDGLTAGGRYKVKVKSECGGGNSSEYSAWLYFSAPGGGRPVTTGSCMTPRELTAHVTGNTAVLRWSGVAGAVGYEVEVENGRNTPPFRLKVTVADPVATVAGLVQPGSYKFKVKSICGAGRNGFYSLWARFATGPEPAGMPTTCGAPVGIQVLNATATSVILTWMPAEGALAYEVEVEDGENTPPFLRRIKTSETTATITGLVPGGSYQVKVKSECGGGEQSTAGGTFFFSVGGPVTPVASEPETATISLRAFPNPADRQLTVAVPAGRPGAPVMVRIVDLSGRVRWQREVHTGEEATLIIPVDTWPAGLYLLQWPSNGEVRHQKLMVTH